MRYNTSIALISAAIFLAGIGICLAAYPEWSEQPIYENQMAEQKVLIGYEPASAIRVIGYSVLTMAVFSIISILFYIMFYKQENKKPILEDYEAHLYEMRFRSFSGSAGSFQLPEMRNSNAR